MRPVTEFGGFLRRDSLLEKGFLGGIAMAAPFYGEFFSWRWVFLLAAPIFLFSLFCRVKIKRPPLAILPLILLLMLHGAALLFSTTLYVDQVLKELIIALFLLSVFLIADEDMLKGFFFTLIPLALATAALGLFKAALLDRGYLIGFIVDGCNIYPAGAALCVNYNNLGFMWLVAAFGCMKTRLWWAIPVLVAAGALSSSRRFIVLVMFLPFLWIMLQSWSGAGKAIFTVLISVLLINLVSDPESFERFRFGGEPYKVLRVSVVQNNDVASLKGSDVASVKGSDDVSINRSTPSVMLGTMTDGTFGTASRLELWKQGVSMVSWWPQGWSYHEVFSCKFSNCTDFHYPHMTIISEWIIGGAILALISIAFFCWPFLQILMTGQLFPVALFLLAAPYALISGDTVLSLPTCVSCMLLALSSVRKKALPSSCNKLSIT